MADENKRVSDEPNLPRLCYDGYVNGEVNEDFLLPDYLPQIDRILRFEYRVVPDEKYLGGKTVEFSGAVAYNVIYVSDDSGMCSVSLSSDYDGRAEIPCDFSECRTFTGVENAACRLLGPRKLSIRAKLRTKLIAFSEDEMKDPVSLVNTDLSIDRFDVIDSTYESRFFEARDLRVDECIEENGGKPVFCNASVLPASVIANNNAVVVSGDVVVRALFEYLDDGQSAGSGRYGNVCVKIPFERAVRCDGVKPGDKCIAEGCCVSVTVGNGEKENTSDCSVNFDLTVTAMRKKEITLCCDAFVVSADFETECFHRMSEIYNAAGVRGNFTLSAAVSKKDIGGGRSDIVDVAVYPEISSVGVDKNKAVFSGTARINIIMKEKNEGTDDAEGYILSSIDFSSPFKYECDAKINEEEILCLFGSEMINAAGRIDGDKIRVESEIAIFASLWQKEKIKVIDSIAVKESKAVGNGFTVMYSDGCENIWNIAKRYRTNVTSLISYNDLGMDKDKRYIPDFGTPIVINNR